MMNEPVSNEMSSLSSRIITVDASTSAPGPLPYDGTSAECQKCWGCGNPLLDVWYKLIDTHLYCTKCTIDLANAGLAYTPINQKALQILSEILKDVPQLEATL